MANIEVTVKRIFVGKGKEYYAELIAEREVAKIGKYMGQDRRFMHLGPIKPTDDEVKVGDVYEVDEDDLI